MALGWGVSIWFDHKTVPKNLGNQPSLRSQMAFPQPLRKDIEDNQSKYYSLLMIIISSNFIHLVLNLLCLVFKKLHLRFSLLMRIQCCRINSQMCVVNAIETAQDYQNKMQSIERHFVTFTPSWN